MALSTPPLWLRIWDSLASAGPGAPPYLADADPVRRVLVTGGAGYIGSALIPKLLDQGYRVRVLDLFLFGAEALEPYLDHPRLEIVVGDLRHARLVAAAMRDVDAVVHLGAVVGDPACALDEQLTIEVNVVATRLVAELARAAGVRRFIFASSCSVYGASDALLYEGSPLSPVSLYARSKIAAECILRELAQERFRPVTLRFGTIYGLSGRARFDLVVNLLAARAVCDGEISISGGDQWRPLVHVDDAAQAICLALSAPAAAVDNETLNVGSDGQNYRIGQVGALVKRLVPQATLVERSADGDPRSYRVSFAKIYGRLGFTARWTVEQGVQQVIAAIASGRVADYRDARYSNLQSLRQAGALRPLRWESQWAHELVRSAGCSQPAAAPQLALARG